MYFAKYVATDEEKSILNVGGWFGSGTVIYIVRCKSGKVQSKSRVISV